ncbi:hypothetical protein VTJ04DRAFT_1608 [Mycothermus thermophilus]|uniref:uncharacterized protein n=1 Tax=Humicola insolens TaxID=85995 RepID=UPI0037423308
MDSSAAASTLTRPRILVAVASLAATITLGYYCYRAYNPSDDAAFALPAEPSRRLHRSNAIRHRRRSIPDVVHASNNHGHSREPSEASSTSVESHDENMHLANDHHHHGHRHHDLHDNESASGDHVTERHVREDNWYDHEPHHHHDSFSQRAGQNFVNLLFRVSEDNARRNAFVHRGCLCNGCGVTPIRGIRYRCANCTDFDLCETCEAQGMHTKTHIFYKIRVPIPRLGSRPLQPVWYPGDPENCLRLLPKHLMPKLTRETGFERPELEALWEQWTFMACTEWREDPDELGIAMDRKTFERYLVPSGGYHHMAPNLLHDRMFAFYDDNNDGLIGFAEFLRGTAYRKRKDRLKKIFRGYDLDSDGYISRRDCLRLFRAYYAVFKHMHRGILEGLEEQAMNAVEVDQVISGRQPLSSLFGREGGFSEADTDRIAEGKRVNLTTGEVSVIDGNHRAVNEDSPDTVGRQDILTDLFTRQSQAVERRFVPITSQQSRDDRERTGVEYLNSLLNPPTSISELPALLLGETRDGNDFLLVVNSRDNTVRDVQEVNNDPLDEALRGGSENSQPSAGESQQPTGATQGATTNGASRENQTPDGEGPGSSDRQRPYWVSSHRRARINARRKLFDRWKRRQFYLDEEEGMMPPEDWSDDDDILARLDDGGDAKAERPPLSARSRSSSKVRFAEDTDDYDVRSNPSTSSRSIPERWGGMDIRDAERDAGKEVFYQVAQQAFNEILDTLFKEKEDLAVQAAETKELRDKYRHLFQSLDPNEKEQPQASKPPSPPAETKEPQDKTLEELLAEAGYSIITPEPEKTADENKENGTGAESDDDGSLPPLISDEPAESSQSQAPEPEVYRDPTMPQFRPNSVEETSRQRQEPSSSETEDQQTNSPESAEPSSANPDSNTPAPDANTTTTTNGSETPSCSYCLSQQSSSRNGQTKKKKRRPANSAAREHEHLLHDPSCPSFSGPSGSTNPIPRATLLTWKRLDLAEKEARERGGWGRLNYEEFEKIYKAAEARGNRLDYLGTWIDFCIPST